MSEKATIRFFDSCVPPLEAGQYQITVEQSIAGIDTGGYLPPAVQLFEVRAPQFVLDPTEIHAVFPPDKSYGEFDQQLPYIVLETPTLPWDRTALEQKGSPWLALLLFRDDELRKDPATGSAVRVGTVDALLAKESDGQVLKPAIDRGSLSQEVLGSNCQSIVVPGAVFRALVPRAAELPLLAFTLEADTEGQVLTRSTEGGSGRFAAVLSNRFPRSGAKSTLHLVSLEGYGPYLANPVFPKKTGSDEEMDVQLVSLWSWSFTTAPAAPQSFAELMRNFVAQQGGAGQNLLLRLPAAGEASTPAEAAALTRLKHGYLPLSYKTATGEQTYAWYRGPLTPVTPQPVPKAGEHATSSAELMIYIQEQGVFDMSYAAAFQLGRALALADKAFAAALLRLRHKSVRLMGRVLDFQHAPYMNGANAGLSALAGKPARSAFDAMVEQNLGGALTAAFGALDALTGRALPGVREPVLQAGPEASAVEMARGLLADQEVQSYLTGQVEEEVDPVADWLADLRLLHGVPFSHLVPDPQMLPVESLRFFYIDPYWTDALVDGALSPGIEGSRDIFLHQVLRPVVLGAVSRKVHQVRSRLAGLRPAPLAAANGAPPEAAKAGLLIRSELVSGWPGLVVKALRDGQPVQLLRMERLSPKVLLCLFAEIPDTLLLSEPLQGLRFGVEDGGQVQLRSLAPPVGKLLGKPFPAEGGLSRYLRPAAGVGDGVLDLNRLLPDLTAAVGGGPVGSAGLAVQLVKAPQQQAFIPPKETRHG